MIKNNNKGFSLIELMVVVGIIGILAAVAVPNLLKFQAKAKQANAKSELSALYGLEKALAVEYNLYSPHLKILGFAPDGLNESNGGLVSGCVQEKTDLTVDASGASATWPLRYYAVGFATSTITYANATLTNAISDTKCKGTFVQSTVKAGTPSAFLTITDASAKVDNGTPLKFTVHAKGKISSEDSLVDVWTIDQNKVLVNTTQGF